MFFTREDILKIQNILLQVSVKDSELPIADPIARDNSLSLVQEGKNKQISLEDFFNQISLWEKEYFINITTKYNKVAISLSEAIGTIPESQRKNGIVITFQDTNNKWKLYQFIGNITNFSNEENWFDLLSIKEGAIGTKEIADNSVTIKKIAEEVWNKLRREYLKTDGSSAMDADLDISSNNITAIQKLESSIISNFHTFLQNYINLMDEGNGISLVLTKSGSGENSTLKCSMTEYGEWTATGFKTTNQSSFGLLGNEGSVITAMTDSDVSKCIASVFG